MMLRIGRPKTPKNRGFTFIELVLVSIIILVLVGLSTPLFRRSFSGVQLKQTCQNLTQLMRYLQAKAIAERNILRLNFDFAQGTFWPTVEDEESVGKFKRIKGRWGATVKAAEGVAIEALEEISVSEGVPYISFYPDGSSDKTKIKISDNKGKSFIITTQRIITYAESHD